MPKIQCFNDVYYIAIPKIKIAAKRWKVGDVLDASFNENGALVYTKVRD